MANEKAFEKKVKNYLKTVSRWQLKTWGNGVQRSGVPDILACVNGYFVAVETKEDYNKPSQLQLWNVRNIRKSGGFAIVLYPDKFDEFKKCVELMLHGTKPSELSQAYFDKEGWFDYDAIQSFTC